MNSDLVTMLTTSTDGEPWCPEALARLDELEAEHGAAIFWRDALKERACREMLAIQDRRGGS